MSNIPLIANLDDPTSPIVGETNQSMKEDLFRGVSQDDELRSSARNLLLSKEESGEKKQESRRASIDPNFQEERRKSSVKNTSATNLESRRLSKFKIKSERHSKSPYNAAKRRSTIKTPDFKDFKAGQGAKSRNNVNPIKARGYIDSEDFDADSRTNTSDIQDIQTAYHKAGKSPNASGEARRKGLSLSPVRNPDGRRKSFVASNRIRDMYFRAMKKGLARRKSEVKEDPEEFLNQVKEIKDSIRTPNDERIKDLVIIEKTPLERLKGYSDTYPLLKFRKGLAKIARYISLISFKIFTHPIFEYFILCVIAMNSIMLALDNPTDDSSPYPAFIDTALLVIYTVEMALKIMGLGFVINKGSYLRDLWNCMDFVIVVTAYIPYLFASGGVNLTAFRSLRVLRPLRTISNIKALKVLILTLIAALGPLMDTLLILFFLFMIFSIAGLQLFMGLLKKRCFSVDEGIPQTDYINGDYNLNYQILCNTDSDCPGDAWTCGKMIANPNWGITNFDTIPSAFLMVFQIVSLEGWSDIMYYLDRTFSPLVAVYFIGLIIIGTFFLLNLTLAVIKAEFTKNAHEGDDKKKKRKFWINNDKMFEKLEDKKGEVLKLMKKRKLGEITYNKYEFKKDNLIALDAESTKDMHVVQKRRRKMMKQQNSKLHRGLTMVGNVLGKLHVKHIARKSIRSIAQILKVFKKNRAEPETTTATGDSTSALKRFFTNLSRKNTNDSKTMSSPMLDSKRRNTAARSIPNNDESPEPGRRASSFGKDSSSEKSVNKGSYKHMMSDRSEKPLADGQTNENNCTKADSEAVGTKREASNNQQEGSKSPSLLVIPSIAEAHEHSEMSMNSPSKAQSRDNLPYSRTSFRKTTIGMKPETQIIRPIIAERVRVRSGTGRKTGEPIAIINIAGIRNKTASASPVKKAKKKLHRGRSNIQKSMVASELSISGEDQSLVELLEAADAEIKKKMNPDKNILLRKINMVNKFAKNPKRKAHRSSTRKISEALPSIFDLADEVNQIVDLQNERELDPLIPTGILDDSDFLDSKQRYELLKRKKLERHSRKQLITRSPSRKVFARESTFGRSPSLAATLLMQNGAADTENNLQVKPLSRASTILGDKPAVAGSSTMDVLEDEEVDRCVIDVRHLKAVADFDRYYDPISLDDVMPSLQEVQERKEEEEERRKLRTTRMKLRFTLTKADQRKAEARIKSYYDPAKSRPTLAMMSNVTTMRLKKKIVGTEGTIVIQNLNANLARNNMSNGSSSNLRSSKTHSLKGLSRKKTGFSTNMTTARSTHHHGDDDDYLAKDKMHDFMEVLKKMKKPFENEAEIDRPEGEEEPKKDKDADGDAAPEKDDKKNKKEKEFKFVKDFKDLRKKDLSTHVVTSKNWSGDNVLRLTNSQVAIDRIKKALNKQDFDIWRPGVTGVLHAGRRLTQQAVETSWFNNIVLISVLLNTVILASQGLVSDGSTLSSVFSDLNFTFTIIFTIEMVSKIIALGLAGYARDKINLFDCFIVILSLVEMIFLGGGGNKAVSAFRTVRLFRTFRVLRVTKLLRSLSYMKVIMGVITRSINKFILIFVLLLLFIFIYALLGMQIFGGNLDVSDNTGQDRIWQNFNSFISAFIVCFQIMTQENWNDLLFLTMRSGVSKPFSLVYLTSWIFIGNYVFLNLFLAILLDEFTGEEAAEDLEEIDEDNEEEDVHHGTSRGPTSDGKTNTNTIQQRTRSLESSFRRSVTSRGETDEESSDHRLKAPKHEQVIACKRSFYIFSKENFVRRFCLALMHHPWFENSVLIMIAVSSIKLGIDTYITDTDSTPYMISKKIDMGINIFFTLEMMTKIISLGFCFDDGSYLRESWNILDFIIVIASLLDMSVSSINLGFIKILRLLRTLRPLRFVTHNPSMRLIVTALLESKTAIFNVLIVIVMIWLMFAILAVNIVGDKLGYCSGFPEEESYYGVSEAACIAKGSGYSWTTPHVNYDNVFWAMLSLFVMSTQENWPNLMKAMADSDDAANGPSENNNRLFAYAYFIVYIFVGSFFLINLFIGVIFLEFTRAEKRENKVQRFLTPQQQRWIIMQKLVLAIKPDVSNVEPEAPWMKKIFKIINHTYFDIFIMIVIILNILTMALTYDGSSDGYNNLLQYINYVFSGIFMMELILKHLGLGFRRYWRNSWNKFDAFVVAASILDIVMDAMEQSFLSFIRVGPQLARVFRVLRVTRLFKLVRSFQGLQKIINTLIFSLPSLMNVGALSFLVYFIYSILGCFLFGTIQTGVIIDDQAHFRNAAAAFVTLFRSSTGENWYLIMFDTIYPATCTAGNSSCGTPAAVPFWITFIVICQYIFLNLFILVLLQQFEEYHLNPDNPVNKFRETLDYIFIPHWEKYALRHGGTHIHEDQLFDFFLTLNTPLGFKNSGTTKKEIAIQIMHMNIPPDAYGLLFYNDVIHAAFKRGFNNEPISDFTQFQYLLKEETKTRNKLETIKKKTISLNLKTGHLFKNPQKTQRKIVGANPIPRILFMGMTMKSWLNYAIRTSEKIKAAKANGIEYVYSDSDPDDYTDEESEHSDEDSYEESDYTESQYDDEEEERQEGEEEEDHQEEEDSKLIKEEDEDAVSSQGGSKNNVTEQQHLIEEPAKRSSDNLFKYDSDEEKASLFDPNDPSPLYNNNPLSKNKFKIRTPKNDTKLTVTSRSRLSQMDASRKSLSKLAATPNIVKTGVEGDVQEMVPRSVYNFADHEKLAHSKNSLEE